MRPTRSAVAGAAAAVVGALLAAGCVAIPSAGPVHVVEPTVDQQVDSASYFSPPGPTSGASKIAIAQGFLIAMQSNPLSTSVAKRFLTARAAAAWRPETATVIYDTFPLALRRGVVTMTLDGADRLDGRGRWRGTLSAPPQALRMVQERGEWRIDNPPDALVIPDSYFADMFTHGAVYFFDQTARILVPEPVFYPRGRQGASTLVKSLLQGPPQPGVSRTFLPRGTALDFSVALTPDGVAEVPVSPQVLALSSTDLRRVAVQLSWTLRQVSGVERIVLTVDGAPVLIGQGSKEIRSDAGTDVDPAVFWAAEAMYGLRDGLLVEVVDEQRTRPTAGPLGRGVLPLRAVTVDLAGAVAAGVTHDGVSLVKAPVESAADDLVAPMTLVSGTDLDRPSWDVHGDLWALDRTRAGGVVWLVSGEEARALDVPGVSGRDVRRLLVSRDGSRLVAVVEAAGDGGRAPGSRLVVARIARDLEGTVTRVLPAEEVTVSPQVLPESSRVVDIGFSAPARLAVEAVGADGTVEVAQVAVDGSPPPEDEIVSVVAPVRGRLVIAPTQDAGVRLQAADGTVYSLTLSGRWIVEEIEGAPRLLVWPG